MESILLVANDFPYPLNHGAAIDMWWHIQTLKNLGFRVDVVVTVKAMPSGEDIQTLKAEVDQLFIVQRQRGFKFSSSSVAIPSQKPNRSGDSPLVKEIQGSGYGS